MPIDEVLRGIPKPCMDVSVCERAIRALTPPANDAERKRLIAWQEQLRALTPPNPGAAR